MKNKKQDLLFLDMPAPPFSKKMEMEEESDQFSDLISGQLEEKLVEEIGAKIDAYFELTGDPITAALTFAHHAFEAAEMASGGSAKNGVTLATSRVRRVSISPSALREKREDEDEKFF